MRTERGARRYIKTVVKESKDFNIEQIDQLVEMHGIMPTVDELLKREIRRTSSQIIGSVKDKNGHRSVYSVSRDGRYANLDNTDILEDVSAIERAQNQRLSSMTPSVKKAGNRRRVILGQMTLEEALEDEAVSG